jgi:hypothetical protein
VSTSEALLSFLEISPHSFDAMNATTVDCHWVPPQLANIDAWRRNDASLSTLIPKPKEG